MVYVWWYHVRRTQVFLRPAFNQILATVMKPYMPLSMYNGMATNHARANAHEVEFEVV
jgi:hypothetical protein